MVQATKSRFMVNLLHQFTVLFLAVHPDHLYMIIDLDQIQWKENAPMP